jgi:hypothetical protein
MKNRTIWRYWAKAIGEKASKCDKESDTVAGIRTFIFATYLITNCFIVAGVIRHWNNEMVIHVEIREAEPTIPMINVSKNKNFEFD